MSFFENLTSPVSESKVCGEDLDELGDEKFLNYIIAAESRLPEQYFVSTAGAFSKGAVSLTPFDRKSINIDDELKQFSKFNAHTRDLRLLTLIARLLVTSGDFVRYVDVLCGCAELLRERWHEVHPDPGDNLIYRQNALEALNGRPVSQFAIQFAPIVNDKQLGSVTLRHYLLSSGEIERMNGDPKDISADLIVRALGKEEHRENVKTVLEAAVKALAATKEIKTIFDENCNYEKILDLDNVVSPCNQMIILLEKANPDLVGEHVSAEKDDKDQLDDGVDGIGGSPIGRGIPSNSGTITTHNEARMALLDVERYLVEFEPTNPSLILVRQSRLLIGKPLIVVLEMLIPNADDAAIILDESNNMKINSNAIRNLTPDITGDETKTEEGENIVENRNEAITLVKDVAQYFRSSEPSSPVPILLKRAIAYFSADFSAIIKDMIPSSQANQ